MNKTTIKKKHKTHKNNIQYRKLRRWVLPAVLGAALSTLAFIPTFAAETQANTNVAVVTTTEQAPTVPSAQGSTPPNGAPHGKPPAGQPPVGAPNGAPPSASQNGAPTGMAPHAEVDSSTFTGTSVVTENKSIAHELITNTTSDQNAFIGKNKAVVNIENSVFDKTGNTTSDNNSNFRGQNAVILGIDGSQINIKGSNITSNSNGSNAVFATGEGSVIYVEDTNIHTKSDSSRGLDATYKGTVNGKNLTITTEGAHSATLATDRGEGTITAEAAKLTTFGAGSPVIYSTGNITANNVNGVANNSEIGVVEGKNSITLTNSNVTGYKDNGFMLYQSFSGDAESGVARLKAENNTLTTHAIGAFIYVNNTTAEVDLSNNAISMPNTTTLVKAAADSRWGKAGENGGHLTLRATNQALSGNILADSISTIALDMTNGSSLVGSINTDNTAKEVTVKISKDSSWTLTGDSYVKSLTNEDTTGENIHLNGYKLVVADK
ncbi:hypothetical protein [uncultured Veillonella sp.]|uniref:hypothetical protein n=1 Tax=uncultured Veillonella sp. TaxID=159268 RepID=UPI00260FE7A8|nr:hypothetical protein [uncultured Veillonella sp.]